MMRSRKSTEAMSHLFAAEYRYYGKYRNGTKIKLIAYDKDNYAETELSPYITDYREVIDPGRMNWIQVTGLSETRMIYNVARSVGLAPLDIKAILTPNHVAKIHENDRRLMVVLRSCLFERNNTVSSEQISIIVLGNVVITFSERDSSKFESVHEAVRDNVMSLRTDNIGLLVAFIINSIFSETIATAVEVENLLEKIDDILLDVRESKMDIGKKIQQCRHAIMILSKNVKPLQNEFPRFFRTAAVSRSPLLMQVFDELEDQLEFVVLSTANSRELLASMRDLYTASNDLRTNAIMKRLTVVSTLFIPITFLVGLWGMNFEFMPETKTKYGYLIALCVIALTAWGTWQFMKRKKWF